MTAVVCPSVTPGTSDPHLFREQIERVSFAKRIQIDDLGPNSPLLDQ